MRMGKFKNIDKELAELGEWIKKKEAEDKCPFDEIEDEQITEEEKDELP